MDSSSDERPTVGSLFSGIGGMDLGLERAGFRVSWQVEWDTWCQRVLAKHWPDVPRVGDIHDAHAVDRCPLADADRGHSPERGERAVPASAGAGRNDDRGRGDGDARQESVQGARQDPCSGCLPAVDLLVGGFPCQPFSNAGKRKGKADDRWLWPEFSRLVGELRPRLVLVENVPGLLAGHGGMGSVLGDLAALGYDAEWTGVSAADVGAPHLRQRVWIVAYAEGFCGELRASEAERSGGLASGGDAAGQEEPVADAEVEPERAGLRQSGAGGFRRGRSRDSGSTVEDADSGSLERWRRGRGTPQTGKWWWRTEPNVGRVAHGVPSRVDRLRGLGNAVVPQVVEVIGRQLREALT